MSFPAAAAEALGMTRNTSPGDETGLLAPQADAATVTAMTRTPTSSDRPDDDAPGRARHNGAQAAKVRPMPSKLPAAPDPSPETMHDPGRRQWQVPLPVMFWSAALVVGITVFAALLVVLLGPDRARTVVHLTPELAGTVVSVVGAMCGLSIWNQSRTPKPKRK